MSYQEDLPFSRQTLAIVPRAMKLDPAAFQAPQSLWDTEVNQLFVAVNKHTTAGTKYCMTGLLANAQWQAGFLHLSGTLNAGWAR